MSISIRLCLTDRTLARSNTRLLKKTATAVRVIVALLITAVVNDVGLIIVAEVHGAVHK